ncbi:MAG: cytidine deaminase [Clostridia bacterium]|nr:cytidine deaminase [Clostridia bacterium]
MSDTELIKEAFKAQKKAYAPYSGYRVGAALLSADDKVVKGCNIENASYGLSNCAERTAVFKAVSKGIRSFKAIAIVGGKSGEQPQYAFPCGACRQVLNEFCEADRFYVIIAKSESDYQKILLSDLLPNGFGPKNIQ